jgi:hypothetical protein
MRAGRGRQDRGELGDQPAVTRLLDWATRFLRTTIHIVRKHAGQ